ncbi:hypothetical protein IQ07DRAFT_608982 [Pyrenochaeta sp. DS3sAY3a]|nr:hypothetical protein IQ07DRAFT_608982 [Pyrenochaeta sp. DS3sAY3a]
MANVVPNIWSQMNYTPPRGQCNYKQSIVSQKCPCLRFMLHPLKSTSSYECDGCTHHASFHNMENKVEDEIRKRWEQEAKDKADQEKTQSRPKKRIRAIEYNASANSHTIEDDDFEIVSGFASRRGRAKLSKKPLVDEDDIVELD